ncbi:hypothetical protein HaLaN_29651 [Haematococcus lacustris]|uniref:Secreted protein n=1 Tax=Haematococcus lacustris TaxID=44745 RepID=A0A6A0AD14_HAELA|nr:hypothetical protein HaLaN_29651 [Haematococcus lacustris]
MQDGPCCGGASCLLWQLAAMVRGWLRVGLNTTGVRHCQLARCCSQLPGGFAQHRQTTLSGLLQDGQIIPSTAHAKQTAYRCIQGIGIDDIR